jgi:hypothetical protein
MVRRYAAFDDGLQMPVIFDLGMFGNEFVDDRAAFELARIVVVAFRSQRRFGGGLVTAPSGGQENDRRQQVVRA